MWPAEAAAASDPPRDLRYGKTALGSPDDDPFLDARAREAMRAVSAQIDGMTSRAAQPALAAMQGIAARAAEPALAALRAQTQAAMQPALAVMHAQTQTALEPALAAMRAQTQAATVATSLDSALAQLRAASEAQNAPVANAIAGLRLKGFEGSYGIDFSALLDRQDDRMVEELLESPGFRLAIRDVVSSEPIRDLVENIDPDEVAKLDLDQLREQAAAEIGPDQRYALNRMSPAQVAKLFAGLYLTVALLVVNFNVPGGDEVVEKIANALTLAFFWPVIQAAIGTVPPAPRDDPSSNEDA